MVIVRARVVVRGFKGSIEETALVDTGATLTLLDRRAAEDVGVRLTGRKVRVVVADGHEVVGELAVVESIVVEGEELPGAHVLVVDVPRRLVDMLRSFNLSDRCILGASTLEILGLAPNTVTGRVEKVGLFLV